MKKVITTWYSFGRFSNNFNVTNKILRVMKTFVKNIFFSYIKVSKDSSARYYWKNKEKIKK